MFLLLKLFRRVKFEGGKLQGGTQHVSFLMELRVLREPQNFSLKISGLRVLCTLKCTFVRSPLLREGISLTTLSCPAPDPSVMARCAMTCSTQLHHKVFNHLTSRRKSCKRQIEVYATHTEPWLKLKEIISGNT